MNRGLHAIALVAVVVLGCIYTYKLERNETRAYPATGVTRLTLVTRNGSISVTAAPDTVFGADITRRCYGRNKADAEEHIESVVVRDTVVGSELRLRAEMPDNGHNYGASFELTSPESVYVSLSTTNGEISLIGMLAGASVSTSNAAVSLLGTKGRFEVTTTNNPVTAQVHCGTIGISTSNAEVDCDLSDLAATESAELATSNGKVTLRLPEDASACFDATTSNGDITVTGFPSVTYEVQERAHKHGQIGSGASTITVTTSNADIIICAR